MKLKAHNAHNILDLGCGGGRHAVALAKQNFSVTGIDYSNEALSLANKWADLEKVKINFIRGDIHQKLPFKTRKFDATLAIDCLSYDTRKSFEFSLKEILRVTKKNGLIFITLPTSNGNPLVTHLVFTDEEIKKFISKYFKIIKIFKDIYNFTCIFAIV